MWKDLYKIVFIFILWIINDTDSTCLNFLNEIFKRSMILLMFSKKKFLKIVFFIHFTSRRRTTPWLTKSRRCKPLNVIRGDTHVAVKCGFVAWMRGWNNGLMESDTRGLTDAPMGAVTDVSESYAWVLVTVQNHATCTWRCMWRFQLIFAQMWSSLRDNEIDGIEVWLGWCRVRDSRHWDRVV